MEEIEVAVPCFHYSLPVSLSLLSTLHNSHKEIQEGEKWPRPKQLWSLWSLSCLLWGHIPQSHSAFSIRSSHSISGIFFCLLHQLLWAAAGRLPWYAGYSLSSDNI